MESAFDPRQAGPMAPIVEQQDAHFYTLRAKEMISEAELSLGTGPTPTNLQLQQYILKINQAIGLLVLARVIRGGVGIDKGAPRPEV